jgi:hypothetical protein
MFDKLFNWGRKKEDERPEPAIRFGRYSDNNKTKQKIARWTDADALFKEKKYHDSITAFFDYLRDDAAGNTLLEKNHNGQVFTLHQGSKVVRGTLDGGHLHAEVSLVRMPQPSVAVMRRLLDQNFALYYTRYALDGDRLCMRFDSDIETASPHKLYYGLKELATRADKQDDLLVQDFQTLQTTDTDHVQAMPEAEKEVKYQFLQKWIADTLAETAAVDAEKFAGGIAYQWLGLVYRIDYLIAPEGKLLQEVEAIHTLYFTADNRPMTDKNRDMAEAFKKIQARGKEEVFGFLFRSRSTFSIVNPTPYKSVADSIHKANDNSAWYRDNNYPAWASKITEYGISFCQFSYSLSSTLSALFLLYMRVNYSDYFTALGYRNRLLTKEGLPYKEAVTQTIQTICAEWREKYPKLEFKTDNLRFDSMANFNFSMTSEIEVLNFES